MEIFSDFFFEKNILLNAVEDVRETISVCYCKLLFSSSLRMWDNAKKTFETSVEKELRIDALLHFRKEKKH